MAVKNQTPEKAWTKSRPSVEYFRVFGCVAYVHVLDVRIKKLDSKSFVCVLSEVNEEFKAYRLYDPVAKKLLLAEM